MIELPTLGGIESRGMAINNAGQVTGFAEIANFDEHAVIWSQAINQPPDCSMVGPTRKELWPPDHKLREVTLAGATDADGDAVTLSITAVTQDEPVNGAGDGNTAPDAGFPFGSGAGRVQLRAERAGGGDGRVYRIAFTADDGRGGVCSGVALVDVPHSRNHPAIDSGGVFNSFDAFP
jgi:probable HAF family extracellular repeat protein